MHTRRDGLADDHPEEIKGSGLSGGRATAKMKSLNKMKEKGLLLPLASKYVKEHSLYKKA
jgi:hypothetical protein